MIKFRMQIDTMPVDGKWGWQLINTLDVLIIYIYTPEYICALMYMWTVMLTLTCILRCVYAHTHARMHTYAFTHVPARPVQVGRGVG